MNYNYALFQFLGGLGIFLFSIKYMGDGLQMSAGDRLRNLLDKYTTNPFLGVLTGILVTILLQSSSGTTVIVVGLVGAGLLNLKQAIGIIMGANIGTTLTTFIIGFNFSRFSLPIIFIGTALLFFTKKTTLNNIGRIFYGFGGIFYALTLMASAMQPLKYEPWFSQLMIELGKNSFLGVIVGTALTMLIQASSATISILQNLYQENLITLKATLPVLFGDNIGTTITAILACIGANKAAKRVALSHTLFNVIGTVIFSILLTPFTKFVIYIEHLLKVPPKLTIAFAHSIFNGFTTILLFPFIGVLAYIVTRIIPYNEEDEAYKPKFLDEMLVHNAPSVAMGQAKKELEVMFRKAIENLNRSVKYFQTREATIGEKVAKKEDELNNLDSAINNYLTNLFHEHLAHTDSEIGSNLMDISRDVERIGDHAMGLTRDVDYQIKKKMIFSDDAVYEVTILANITNEMLKLALESFIENDKNKAIEALDLHNSIYVYEKKTRKKHINRLRNGDCDIKSGLYYVDIICHFTRICDHARNVVERVINNQI